MRRADIPAHVLAALNAGTLESATLAEGLAVDYAALLAAAVPDMAPACISEMAAAADLGITRRMNLAAKLLLSHGGTALLPMLSGHASDTVRGFACFVIGLASDLAATDRLNAMRPFADDPHFGVREWAWMAVRPHVARDLGAWMTMLEPLVHEQSERLRRFAIEITRPRGVWCAHLAELRHDPAKGLALLVPVRNDPAKYVQDSVGNWLNDAAKDHPEFVRDLCAVWEREGDSPANRRIRSRALRSIKGKGGDG
ncbi:DNA alkylation repair protein [Desulfovibrio sulfodismutans]|uniref:DNA alkylation repair protein n=1 Tax=Desulfolutivibrio sulfodismutans TaxID=63561 RepID=A0A7K3NPZ5_9BACT|nr:DNA alkylation repair protein [Desulfolutivibrio sulfodismutans]QLA14385.1 DNA alkylation repair protein [Desulfolutivibrio sulfodismutans DSM 3696]